MSKYLFIQSQDPFTEGRARRQFELIRQLHEAGHDVSVLLVQNGVTPARRGARGEGLDQLLNREVAIYADAFSLEQRELDEADLKDRIGVSGLHIIIDAMLARGKVIWH